MSITAPDDRVSEYSPVVATTEFPAVFPVFDNDDLAVIHNGLNRDDFTVTATYADGISSDAKAVFASGITGDVKIVGRRQPHRTNRFSNGAPLPIRDQNLALDTLEAESQEARRDIGRAVKVAFGAPELSISDSLNDGEVLIKMGTQIVGGPNVADLTAGLRLFRLSLTHLGCKGDGTDDTIALANAISFAVANGFTLTGDGKVYGFSGKLSLPSNLNLWDAEIKQLLPGASLSVITIEANVVNNLDLRRVKVNRNGDGTNGGLLNASGANGAMNSAYGMAFIGGVGHHFEDLEVYGNDSGTGILFRQIGESSRIIRPYAHDIGYSRTAASDDQVQGITFDQCTRVPIEDPRAINLTGIINGVASRRWTRGISIGASIGLTVQAPYVEHADQGVDITGGPTPNRECVVTDPVVRDIWTWGGKMANTARRCSMRNGRAYDCGVGFVASPNSALTSDVTTDDSDFTDCVSYNAGSNGQAVITSAGFRVLQTAATAQGRARNIRFVRCKAIDEQAVKTMQYGFMSEITDVSVAPVMIDCESIGHVTAAINGTFKSINGVGTVQQTSGLATGASMEFTTSGGDFVRKTADGHMEQWGIIDDTAADWTTAAGALFRRTALLSKNWPVAFVGATPTVSVEASRGDSTVMFGAYPRDVGLTSINIMPWATAAVANGNDKSIHWHAKGRWF